MKIQSPSLTVSSLSHLTSCTPTKSNLYLSNSLAASASEHVLYCIGSLHSVCQSLMSLFLCLGPSKVSVQTQGTRICFTTRPIFYGEKLLALRPTPKLEDHPLSACSDCLFGIFAAALHIGGSFSIRNRYRLFAGLLRTFNVSL